MVDEGGFCKLSVGGYRERSFRRKGRDLHRPIFLQSSVDDCRFRFWVSHRNGRCGRSSPPPPHASNCPSLSMPALMTARLVAKESRAYPSAPNAEPGTKLTWADSRAAWQKLARIGDLDAAQRFAVQGGDVEEGVERPVRRGAADAGQLGQAAAHQIAAGGELPPHVGDALLVAFQGGQGRILADAARAAGLLALHVAHRLDDVQRRRPPSPCASRSWRSSCSRR